MALGQSQERKKDRDAAKPASILMFRFTVRCTRIRSSEGKELAPHHMGKARVSGHWSFKSQDEYKAVEEEK